MYMKYSQLNSVLVKAKSLEVCQYFWKILSSFWILDFCERL